MQSRDTQYIGVLNTHVILSNTRDSRCSERITNCWAMELVNGRYACMAVFQLLLLAVDLLCNSSSILLSFSQVILAALFAIQSIAQVINLVLLLLAFFNTFAFSAGLVSTLLKKFAWSFVVGGVYFLFSLALQVWWLVARWDHEGEYIFTGPLQAMYALQKLLSVGHYLVYKRAVYRLSDQRYYENSEWLRMNLR